MRVLEPIEDVKKYIDSNGIALVDFLNKKGAVLVKSGMPIHSAIYHMAVYQIVDREKNFMKSCLHENPFDSLKTLENRDFSNLLMVDVSKDLLPVAQEAIDLYNCLKKDLETIFNTGSFSIANYQYAIHIVEQTFNESRTSLIKALWLLRKHDHYTCDHSLSVCLLFLEVLDDLKKHRLKYSFYSSLKKLGSKVHFNLASVRHYALGALLHDYGKICIEEKLIDKKSALTTGELDIIRLHSYYGIRGLKLIGVDDPQILDIVGNHHYNYRVDDTSQSPLAQICNMVDIYDACRSERSYKKRFSWEQTLSILEKEFAKAGWDSFIYKVIVEETLMRMESLLGSLQMG